ncbi:oxidoreductase FAD/NAD(P)-binding domain protein [Halorhabdus utahensis DSM 12940]|uniref:Oxidoreductase FAD/NAD(P)-binding domain protein n=1 Tax=Halorhabdus utahensis (strain DSM 12940 / JCM 11049 / AX-2) TaxID=519442 RepID=C7NV14_HALUD|nr:FAD-binding oxidoreductase [Halorhabdus utahensis]ACV12426.1 oxidoreductase FAD/NAD(P)-binding domain protein [Halorhabdus utahensis DSM 12940]
MIEVRRHASQHDAIGELPLLTESARVTAVTYQDDDRSEEIATAMERLLADVAIEGVDGAMLPGEWEAAAEAATAAGRADLARQVTALGRRYDRPYPMLAAVRFDTAVDVDFVAGQYVGLTYEGIPRAYSLSNSPAEDELEICVRRVPGGRLSPRICADLAVGDELTIRGPYGELVLGDHAPRDLAFVATGTGVAPLKSMIEYLFETGRDEYDGQRRDVWLFLGADWTDDLPYREYFRDLAATRENFHFVPCLVFESLLSEWEGETDFVQDALLAHVDPDRVTTGVAAPLERRLRREPRSGVDARIDPGNVDVYACGINAMVYSLLAETDAIGVPDQRVEVEGFG